MFIYIFIQGFSTVFCVGFGLLCLSPEKKKLCGNDFVNIFSVVVLEYGKKFTHYVRKKMIQRPIQKQ